MENEKTLMEQAAETRRKLKENASIIESTMLIVNVIEAIKQMKTEEERSFSEILLLETIQDLSLFLEEKGEEWN